MASSFWLPLTPYEAPHLVAQAWLAWCFMGRAGRVAGGCRRLETPARGFTLGTVAWVIGYDTLYAIQDLEDDALVGVKSSALRLGESAPVGVAIFYALALLLWGAAIWSVRPDWVALIALLPAAMHLANQALRVDPADGGSALKLFRSNRTCGLLVFMGMLAVGLSSR